MRTGLDENGQVRAVPLISYVRARPILLAWAESIGDTLDVCPLPTLQDQWVYISGAHREPFKVGFTTQPNVRPFTCWRDYRLKPNTYPLVLISGAGRNVERLIKRAGYPWSRAQCGWNKMNGREAFDYVSPIRRLVRELRVKADACFHESPLFGLRPDLIEIEYENLRRSAA